MQKHKAILASILILSLFSQNAFAFLPLGADNIIIQNINNIGITKQGTINTTLANNSPVNVGAYKLNFINGTGNPVNVKNSTNGMVNVTITMSPTGASVTSLNALTGALTIACVSGNTTCTTSGGNTITINTAYNIVTTGLSAQTISKALTVNNLILGGQMNINGQTFQSGGHTYSWPATTGTICLTNQTGTCGPMGTATFDTMQNIGSGQAGVFKGNSSNTNFQFKTLKQGANIAITNNTNDITIAATGLLSSAITSVNGQIGPAITVNRGTVTNMSSITNSSNVISYQMKNDVVLTNGSSQTVTKQLTLNTGILGGNLVTTGFGLSNGGHISTPPATTGTLCQTNQSSVCGSGLSAAITSINSDTTAAQKIVRQLGNTTVTNSSGTITIGFGVNPVITGGSAQTFSKNLDFGGSTTDKFASSGIIIRNPANTFGTTVTNAAITANRTLNLPLITGTDTLGALGMAQTWTSTNTYTGLIDQQNTGTLKASPSGIIVRNPANTFATTLTNTAITANRTLQLPLITQTETISVVQGVNFTSPSNPATTTSTTGVMSNLFATFTPHLTGKLLIHVCGNMDSGTAGDGASFDVRIGTSLISEGTAIGNTVIGSQKIITSSTASKFQTACNEVYITGLTVGTKEYIQIGKYAITGGTAAFQNFDVFVMEVE